jgi:hypothetical protein
VPAAFVAPQDQGNARGLAKENNLRHAGMGSHVLLAACGEEEEARELNGRGLFTEELLIRLKLCGVDGYTYEGLITSFRSLAQYVFKFHAVFISNDARIEVNKTRSARAVTGGANYSTHLSVTPASHRTLSQSDPTPPVNTLSTILAD